MSLFHHSCGEVSNDAHLVHISCAVHLPEQENNMASVANDCALYSILCEFSHPRQAHLKAGMFLCDKI